MSRKEPFVPSVVSGKRMFFGNVHGGDRGALLYGLIGTYRLNGIDPEAYLHHNPERTAGMAFQPC